METKFKTCSRRSLRDITCKALAILSLLSLSLATSAAQSEAVYRFEIRMTGQSEVFTVQAKAGETKVVKTTGNTSEYTSSQTTLPSSTWQRMVKAGTAPDHDFVSCTKKTCTYGVKAKITDYEMISLRPMKEGASVLVSVAYDRAKSRLPAVVRGISPPEVDHWTSMSSIVMQPGDTMRIADSWSCCTDKDGVVALIKFVGAE